MSEEELFDLLLQTSADQRADLLAIHCGDNPDLRLRVEALLEAYTKENILDRPLPQSDLRLAQDRWRSCSQEAEIESVLGYEPGATVGSYTLECLLGEGGMGVVWVAKQTSPVKRRVALKLVKAGMDSRDILARFDHERQALGSMDHPNIARVFDGGLTPEGRPYFAMELVNGLPLTQYCDETRLSTDERLEIFIQICFAVQHAHQKGIIHRDLKPANILVTEIDGKPVPKVIDFGVSKAVSGNGAEATTWTRFGTVLGTLEYMAPEQAGYSGTDVDTRTDIYALGVILYELLTGLRPFDSQRLRQAAIDEVRRILCEEEPSKPSARLSSSESRPDLAALRRTEPSRLTQALRGDLDWIILKCLEKDRNRRYASANELAAEIQRHRNDEPVMAGPPTARYLIRKFMRRYRHQAMVGALLLGALLVGLVASLHQMNRAIQAERIANHARKNEETLRIQAEELQKESERNAEQANLGMVQANNALYTFTDDALGKIFDKSGGLSEEERAFLQKILSLFDELVKLDGEQSSARDLQILGYWRIGRIQKRLNAWNDAFEAHEKLCQLLREKVAKSPDSIDLYVEWLVAAREAVLCLEQEKDTQRATDYALNAEKEVLSSIRQSLDSEPLQAILLDLKWDRTRLLPKEDAIGAVRKLIDECERIREIFPESVEPMVVEIDAICGLLDWTNPKYGSQEVQDLIARAQSLIELVRLKLSEETHEHFQLQLGTIAMHQGFSFAASGDSDGAAQAFRRATHFYRKRLRNKPGDQFIWSALGRSIDALWGELKKNGNDDESYRELRELHRFLAESKKEEWSGTDIYIWKAQVHHREVEALQRQGRNKEELLRAQLEAARYREENLDLFDDRRAYKDSITYYYKGAAETLLELQRPREAFGLFKKVITIREELLAESPEPPDSLQQQFMMAWDHFFLARTHIELGERAEADTELAESMRLLQVVIASPTTDGWSVDLKKLARDDIGSISWILGDRYLERKDWERAARCYNIGIQDASHLAGNPQWALCERLAKCYSGRGLCAFALGKTEEGVADFKNGIASCVGAEVANTNRLGFVEYCAHQLEQYADSRHRAGLPVTALPIYRYVLKTRRDLAAANPDAVHYEQQIIWSLHNIHNALMDMGDFERLAEVIQDIDRSLQRIYSQKEVAPGIALNISTRLNQIAHRLRINGPPELALIASQKTLEFRRFFHAMHPDNFDSIQSLAWGLHHLCLSQLLLKQNEEAIISSRESIAIVRNQVAARPSSVSYWNEYERLLLSDCVTLAQYQLREERDERIQAYLQLTPEGEAVSRKQNAQLLKLIADNAKNSSTE